MKNGGVIEHSSSADSRGKESPIMATVTGAEDRVLATAQHIVNSLRTSKDATDDMLFILSTFDNRFSNMSSLVNGNSSSAGGGADGLGLPDTDPEFARFESAEQVIIRHDSGPKNQRNRSLWNDQSADEACEYLAAIDEVLLLMEDLRFQENGEAMNRAEIAVQTAIAKLEEEFRNVLSRSTVPLDGERLYGSIRTVSLSFVENEGEEGIIDNFQCVIGEGTECGGGKRSCHERGRSYDVSVDLIKPEVMADLREIAQRMIRAGYEKECCQIFSSVRRDVLDEYLQTLGLDKLSIEEIQRVDWRALDEKMKKWIQSLKIMMKVLNGERRLCDQVFDDESELIKEVCFVETASGCVMQLLNFGDAVAIGNRSSEKLFRILDMYDALEDALPELQGLFVDESGEFLCREAKTVLDGLGEAARGTFAEFEKAVKGESSKKPTHGAEIHPLARYVMNYVKLLVDYSETLNSLLESDVDDDGQSPLARCLLSLIGSLELNLEEKAKLYEDSAMQCIFLMNNKLYIVQKVKDSDLANLLGDDWVRRRRGLVRKYATNYLRASWSKALSCLRDEGLGGSSNASKMALKERFKCFNASFEEVYRIQTGWKVTDSQLRTELRISVSEKVIPAYRAFLGRFGNQLESGRNVGRYIKYSAEDLEGYLGDLFEGTPAVLHHVRR